MLVDQRAEDAPFFFVSHGLHHLPKFAFGILLVFVHYFRLFDVDSWFSSFSFVSKSFAAILFEVPWFLAIKAHTLLPFLFRDFYCIDVHMVLGSDVIPLFVVEKLEEVGLHLRRISSYSSLSELKLSFQEFPLIFEG
jgi:hypothetical protein